MHWVGDKMTKSSKLLALPGVGPFESATECHYARGSKIWAKLFY